MATQEEIAQAVRMLQSELNTLGERIARDPELAASFGVALTCNQSGCGAAASFRYTWPGRNEAGICEAHAEKVRGIAVAMGLYVQLIPLKTEACDA